MKRIVYLFLLICIILATVYLTFSITILAETTFTAEIISISGDIFVVRGLDTNDINHRSDFRFTVDSSAIILWNNTVIHREDLSVGQMISVTHMSTVTETAPAGIDNILKIVLLSDN